MFISNDENTEKVCRKYPVIRELLLSVHGSGIDYDWCAEEKGENIFLYNSFHTMNAYGMYDYIVDFGVKIPKNSIFGFKVFCIGSRYAWNKYMLKDDISDRIYYALEEIVENFEKDPEKRIYIVKKCSYKLFEVKGNEGNRE